MKFYFPPYDQYKPSTGQLLKANMVGYYSMDGAAGTDEADATGTAEDAVRTSDPTSVAGKVGTARACNIATPNYFTIAAPHSFMFASSFTITAWVNIVAFPNAGYQYVFDCGSAWNGGWDMKITWNEKIAFILWAANNDSWTMHGNILTAGAGWSFGAITHDISTKYMAIYTTFGDTFELRESKTYVHTYDPPNTDVRVGGGQGAATGEAYLDAITAFNKALTLEELTWIYNEGAGRAYADYA